MNKEKRIEGMASVKDIKGLADLLVDFGRTYDDSIQGLEDLLIEAIISAGYRKIYDDHQRQCTCYALGCQMAESLKTEIAREIFEELEKRLVTGSTFYGHPIHSIGVGTLAELKKKYTVTDTNVGCKDTEEGK